MHRMLLTALFTLALAFPVLAQDSAPIRVGMIGLDTSHVVAFTKVLNDPDDPQHVPGAKVVAAVKGGSPDLASSRDRIDGFTARLVEGYGIEIVPDIPALCERVDAILLESVDGRKHLEQARQAFQCGVPVFIDKPLAASFADALEIARLGAETGTPWWSSSSLRYSPAAEAAKLPGLTGAITWGPGPLEPTHELDLSWYGIHPIELLYAVMGPGCKRVTRTYTDGADAIVGEWADGRLGIVRTIREGKKQYGLAAFGAESVEVSPDAGAQYSAMLGDVVQFFRDGKPPVPNAETLEIFAFMQAALESKRNGGKPTPLPATSR